MSEPPAPRPIPAVRVTVAQREIAEARLRRAAGDGLLTLEEYGDRVRVVLEATTRNELEVATADLPAWPRSPRQRPDAPAGGPRTGCCWPSWAATRNTAVGVPGHGPRRWRSWVRSRRTSGRPK
ncbi:MAG: DUF1707 domain-containing protein [Nitriliruptorales bacterium]|nr:DUF1707 domain-containing protein [Nitriliruptorales bacterium]